MKEENALGRLELLKFVLWDIILYGVLVGLGTLAVFRSPSNDGVLSLLGIVAIVVMAYFTFILLMIFVDILFLNVDQTVGKLKIAFTMKDRRYGHYSHMVEVSPEKDVRVRMAKSSYKYKDSIVKVSYGKFSKQVLFVEELSREDIAKQA